MTQCVERKFALKLLNVLRAMAKILILADCFKTATQSPDQISPSVPERLEVAQGGGIGRCIYWWSQIS